MAMLKRQRQTTETKTVEKKTGLSAIPTIPNTMTLVGGAMTWLGAKNIGTLSGLTEVVIGRTIDAFDGVVARKTGQTSDFGAALDAGIDKFVTAKLLYEMWQKGAAPEALLGIIATHQAINTGATLATNLKHQSADTRPTRAGKLAMATETASLFAYVSSFTAENSGKPEIAEKLRRIGLVAFVASVPLAIRSTASYVKRASE